MQTEHKQNSWKDLLRFAIITACIVLPIRLFIAQPFVVSGSSMDPTFENGQYLIVDELSYRFDEPKRGDVVIFRFPFNKKKFLIKRIIGLPGETVIVDKEVTIKNDERPNGFTLEEPYVVYRGNDVDVSVTLKESEYFVMGDNREASIDSRVWGPLGRNYIVGTPLIRLFPLSEIDMLPGNSN